MHRLLALLLFTSQVYSFNPKIHAEKIEKQISDQTCRDKFRKLSLFHLLFSKIYSPSPEVFARDPSIANKLVKGWSAELLLRSILEIDSEFAARCGSVGALPKVALQLKRIYVQRISTGIKARSPGDIELAYRALAVPQTEVEKTQRLFKSFVQKSGLANSLSAVLGRQISESRGIVISAPSETERALLVQWSTEVCGKLSPCRFWDSRALYRVNVVKEPGIAAFIPEPPILLLSEELLQRSHLLNQLVVTHELAHIAHHAHELVTGTSWEAEFRNFSGWTEAQERWSAKVKKQGVRKSDSLQLLSKGSLFSIMPDFIYVGEQGYDGFAMGKTYETVLTDGDPGEDFADHVALFRLLPERYCLEGKNIASKKFEWIAKTVFTDRRPEISCSKAN